MEGRKKLNIADNELLFIIIIVKAKTISVSCSQTWKKLDKGHKYVAGKKIMVCFPRLFSNVKVLNNDNKQITGKQYEH